MSVVLEEMLAESGLAREEMTDVFEVLAPLGDLPREVPTPSAELAALLGPAGTALRPSALFGRGRRGAVAGAVLLAISGVGATGLSAAANTLPRPLQERVSQFSHDYLPFDLPPPPPPPQQPVDGLPALTPGAVSAPTERTDDSTSRSLPGRPTDRDATLWSKPSQASSASTPYAAPYAQPSSSPSDAWPGAPSPMAQSSASPPSTPPDLRSDESPRGGKGHHSQAPAPGKGPGKGHGPDKGKDPGTENNKNHGNGNGHGHDQGPVNIPAPAPAPAPKPQPDPPTPTIPLPDPLPDLGPILDPGSVDTGAVAGD